MQILDLYYSTHYLAYVYKVVLTTSVTGKFQENNLTRFF